MQETLLLQKYFFLPEGTVVSVVAEERMAVPCSPGSLQGPPAWLRRAEPSAS